jgi:signal transduction histidine kinase
MTQRKPASLKRRLMVAALGGLTLALVAGGWGLSRAFEAAVERGFDERLQTVLQTVIAEAATGRDGQLLLSRPIGDPRFDRIYSGSYWQISSTRGVLLRSRSLWDQEIPFSVGVPDGSTLFRYWENQAGQHIRLAERDLTLPGHEEVLHFIVAGRTHEIEEELRRFDQLITLGILGLLLLLGTSIAAQMRIGLQPLRVMLQDLTAVWEGRAQRVNEHLPSELRPLAVTINQLLSHEDRQVARARDQAADLAHAIKTPLAVLRADIDTLDTPLAESMRQRLDLIDGLVRRNLARANAGRHVTLSGLLTPLKPVVEQIHQLMQRVHPDSAREVALDIPDKVHIRLEQEDLEEVMGNLLDNAWKWSRNRIRVSATVQGERCILTVEDDGPGLAEANRQKVMERRVKLDERVPGQGLGLPIARDIIEPAGGTLALGGSSLGGLGVTLTLPVARTPQPATR